MKTHKIFNLVIAFVFAFSLLGVPVPVLAQDPNPTFAAHLPGNQVHAYNWAAGSILHLTIDDANISGSPDFTASEIVLDNDLYGNTWTVFELTGFELKPGQFMSITDGTTTKTHEVKTVKVSSVNPTTETVTGTAEPNTEVGINAHYAPGGDYVSRRFTTDEHGIWSIDLSLQGPNPGEDRLYDIMAGSWGTAFQWDEDNDSTFYEWRVLNNSIFVAPLPNALHAWDWPDGAWVTLNLDNPYTLQSPDYTETKQASYSAPWAPQNTLVAFVNGGYNIKAGDVITVTDGITIKTHITTYLTVDGFDVNADTITGTAEPGSTVSIVRVCDTVSCSERTATTNQSGYWVANFSIPGDANHPETIDIRTGTEGIAYQYDDDGDATQINWRVPNPTFFVVDSRDSNCCAYNVVGGEQWEPGKTISLYIDDPSNGDGWDYQDSLVALDGQNGWANSQWTFYIDSQVFPIKAGYIVRVTDGTVVKDHVVKDLVITNIDLDADTVEGQSNSDEQIYVPVMVNDEYVERFVSPDINGHWIADFSQPGEQGNEQALFNIGLGTLVIPEQADEDGDSTKLWQNVPNPSLHAVPTHPEVHGHDWSVGSDITLTIDNDTDPTNGVFYTRIKNVDDDPWCGNPCFDLAGVFDLEVGQYVTMTDGAVTKTVQVSTLKIMSVDLVNDTISGVADPGSEVMVNIWSQDGKARHTIADGNGDWSVNFSVIGDEDFEQFTTDITYGDNGRAIQLNPDGTDDGTLEYWNQDWVAPDTIPLVAAFTSLPNLARLEYTTDGWALYNLLWEPLFRATDQGLLTPAAATGYTLSADGLVYTITLRSDLLWSDGQPITAQQYVDGFLRILAPDTMTDYASLLYDIQGANEFNNGLITDPHEVGLLALNAHTLQITMERPAVYFQQVLAIPGIMPVRTDLIAQYGDAWTAAGNFEGTGPFRLVEYDKGHILLEKNMAYHDASTVAFETIGFDIFADMDEAFNAYQRGEVDVLIDAPQSALDDPNIKPERVYAASPGVIYVGLNTQRTPTDNPLVRQALSAATDRRALLDNVLKMPWLQAATGVIPSEIPGYQGTNVGYGYDLALAQDLLAQAGYSGGADLPTIYLYGRPGWAPALDAIAEQWRTGLGISVETYYIDDPYGEYMHQCLGSPACTYNAYRWGWLVDFFDAKNILEEVFHPDSYFNLMGWDNARYRELIELSRGEQDPAQRLAYFQEAEQILVENEAVVIPLYFTERVSLVKPGYTTVYGLIPYFDLWNNVHQNQPPIANAGPDHVTFAGDTITLDASASFDPDTGPLTYTWDLDNDGLYDDASGVTAATSFQQPGNHEIELQVTDAGGLSDTDTVMVTVLAWTLKGFYQPVDMNGVYNVVKGGSTVPLKFEIFAGSAEQTDVADIKGLTYAQTSCDTNAIIDEIETTTTGGTSLRYADGQFIYNWKTPTIPGKCYRVTMTTLDGSSLVAYFKLK